MVLLYCTTQTRCCLINRQILLDVHAVQWLVACLSSNDTNDCEVLVFYSASFSHRVRTEHLPLRVEQQVLDPMMLSPVRDCSPSDSTFRQKHCHELTLFDVLVDTISMTDA